MNRPARAPVVAKGKLGRLFRRERKGCDRRSFKRQAGFETVDLFFQPKLFFFQRSDAERITARLLFEALHLEIKRCVPLTKRFNPIAFLTQNSPPCFLAPIARSRGREYQIILMRQAVLCTIRIQCFIYQSVSFFIKFTAHVSECQVGEVVDPLIMDSHIESHQCWFLHSILPGDLFLDQFTIKS